MGRYMIDIFKYISRDKIEKLCDEAKVPREAAERALRHIDEDDFAPFAPHINGLFSGETGEAAAKEIERMCREPDGGEVASVDDGGTVDDSETPGDGGVGAQADGGDDAARDGGDDAARDGGVGAQADGGDDAARDGGESHKPGRQQDDGFKEMAIFLIAALRTREAYEEMGIDDGIFIHTMSLFRRIIAEYVVHYGKIGFNRGHWFYRQIANVITRLGVLEFETLLLDEGAEVGLPGETNVPVLSVHIPSDAVMTREALDESYQTALQFFPKYYPDFKFKRFHCSTWLLAPALRELLQAGSRILNFQDDYCLTDIDEDDKGHMFWIFNIRGAAPDYAALPEDTALRRAAKRHLMAGGRIGAASGYVSGRNAVK